MLAVFSLHSMSCRVSYLSYRNVNSMQWFWEIDPQDRVIVFWNCSSSEGYLLQSYLRSWKARVAVQVWHTLQNVSRITLCMSTVTLSRYAFSWEAQISDSDLSYAFIPHKWSQLSAQNWASKILLPTVQPWRSQANWKQTQSKRCKSEATDGALLWHSLGIIGPGHLTAIGAYTDSSLTGPKFEAVHLNPTTHPTLHSRLSRDWHYSGLSHFRKVDFDFLVWVSAIRERHLPMRIVADILGALYLPICNFNLPIITYLI